MATTLPAELLSLIFQHAHEISPLATVNCRTHVAAAVCHRWRAVALGNPLLWRDIHIQRTVDGHKRRPQGLRDLLGLQLQRSGQITLRVRFAYPDSDIAVFKLLLTTTDRWAVLDIELTGAQRSLLMAYPAVFPSLVTLTLRHVSTLNLGGLSFAPHVTDVRILGPITPLPAALPWDSVTRCILLYINTEEALAVLNTAAALQAFCVSAGSGVPPGLGPLPPLCTAPALRSLRITRSLEEFVSSLLGKLAAPDLQSLMLDTLDVPAHVLSPLLRTFISASPGLTSLSLTRVSLSEPDLIALLPLLPALTRLAVVWPADVHTRSLIGALTLTGLARTSWLPHLTDLTLVGGLSVPDTLLFAMLHSRRKTLKRVGLFYAGRTFFFDRSLDGLRAGGMTVDMNFEVTPGSEYKDDTVEIEDEDPDEPNMDL
ncbi:F-box domain-containing protein [Mycena indigotica]|uniref:F-box domain-containing protein n=1 Tax=Mycena indigotica TaxID=2126181 RepID=A0A8H6T7T3_9AGAR|nr:F-box domain-containing protein [Mycena indigotica]KAF7312638.1 F-box domain-containing protein [Mycena indigotica]